jgi:peptidoglycan/LPS O-acetylase OafA/YrhL
LDSGTIDFLNPANSLNKAERNHGLDLLRGLAALGIVVYHYLYMAHGITVGSLGTFGVYLFFMLSGLTMMLVYGPTFSSAISLQNVLRFYRNRIARILPLLCAMATISLAFTVLSNPSVRLIGGSAIHSFLTGSGLFALHLPGYLSNVTGAWSLGIGIAF